MHFSKLINVETRAKELSNIANEYCRFFTSEGVDLETQVDLNFISEQQWFDAKEQAFQTLLAALQNLFAQKRRDLQSDGITDIPTLQQHLEVFKKEKQL